MIWFTGLEFCDRLLLAQGGTEYETIDAKDRLSVEGMEKP